MKQLNDDFNVIHVINRNKILDDALHLCLAGLLDMPTLLSLTTYLVKETNVTPFLSINAFMSFSEIHMRRDKNSHTKLQVNE